jgi:hypothetical protein
MHNSRSRLLNPNSAERISPKSLQAAQASKSSSTEHPATPAKLAPAMDSMDPMSSRNSMAPTSLAETASDQRSGYAWQWECNFRAHAEFQRRGEHGRSMAKLSSQSAWEGGPLCDQQRGARNGGEADE